MHLRRKARVAYTKGEFVEWYFATILNEYEKESVSGQEDTRYHPLHFQPNTEFLAEVVNQSECTTRMSGVADLHLNPL